MHDKDHGLNHLNYAAPRAGVTILHTITTICYYLLLLATTCYYVVLHTTTCYYVTTTTFYYAMTRDALLQDAHGTLVCARGFGGRGGARRGAEDLARVSAAPADMLAGPVAVAGVTALP